MKKLSELGISPAPWRFTNYGVIDLLECGVVYSNDCPYLGAADARLIAAAPELYKWLAFAVEYYKCETRSCDECPNGKCWIVDATAALAKAAGEEVGDGKQ